MEGAMEVAMARGRVLRMALLTVLSTERRAP
jgi:hypothetical protein